MCYEGCLYKDMFDICQNDKYHRVLKQSVCLRRGSKYNLFSFQDKNH